MSSIAPAPYRPSIAIAPGETIRSVLRDMGMSQAELAVRMKRPTNKVNEIIKGKRQITVETALELELTLGLPADFWINLEKNYQLTKARLAEEARLAAEAEVLRKFPLRDMIRLRWIEKKPDVRSQVRELLGFFGVASFSQLQEVKNLSPAWRKAQTRQPCSYALCAWLRRGVLQAGKIATGRFDGRGIEKDLNQLKTLTTSGDFPKNELVATCANRGIAVVFVPHLTKSFVNGAAYWLHEKAVIQLSGRYRWSDILWFNFFHELAHILLHSRHHRKAFLDDNFSDSPSFTTDNAQWEQEANNFAQEALIPQAAYQELLMEHYRTPPVIRRFARQLGIGQGIIVGRLQHDKKIHPSMLNDLRTQVNLEALIDL